MMGLAAAVSDLHERFIEIGAELGPDDEAVLNLPTVAGITEQLRLMMQVAHAMEQELQVHRLSEANRAGRAMVEELATDVMSDVLLETRGNVIRANFRRNS